MEASISSIRNLSARTVHLKIYPSASTFAERREVLRVMERFGEVAFFKSFKHIEAYAVPNAFLAIFSTESAANDMQNASPIRYRLISDTPNGKPASPISVPDGKAVEEQTEGKIFEISINRSNYSHTEFLTSSYNPLHGQFTPISPRRSSFAAHLRNTIPKSLWSAGLADWESGGLTGSRWRVSGGGVEERHGADVPLRFVLKRRRELPTKTGLKNLKALWEEGEEARRRQQHEQVDQAP